MQKAIRRKKRRRRKGSSGPGQAGPVTEERLEAEQRIQSLQRQLSLQQQISVLRWRKAQASSKIRNILASSRAQRAADTSHLGQVKSERSEHSQWVHSVVESEMQRPLQVDDDFIQNFQSQTRHNHDVASRNLDHHLHIVRKMKTNLVDKEASRRRARRYKFRRAQLGLTTSATRAIPHESASGVSERLMTERIEDLDALERHLLLMKQQQAGVDPAEALRSPASDLYLLRLPRADGGLSGSSTIVL